MTKLSGGGLYGGNRSGMSMSGEAEKRRGGEVEHGQALREAASGIDGTGHFFFSLNSVMCRRSGMSYHWRG